MTLAADVPLRIRNLDVDLELDFDLDVDLELEMFCTRTDSSDQYLFGSWTALFPAQKLVQLQVQAQVQVSWRVFFFRREDA